MSAEYRYGQYGQTWLEVPKNMVGFVVGKNYRNLYSVMEKTSTKIENLDSDKKTYFRIGGTAENCLKAKLKIKELVTRCKKKNKGLDQCWFPLIDAKEGIFELQPCSSEVFLNSVRLSFKGSFDEDEIENGNFNFLLQELPRILKHNQEYNRSSNVWCHFGKVHINGDSLEYNHEYSFSEVERNVLPKRLFAPEELKWHVKFNAGLHLTEEEAKRLYTEWFPFKYQKCVAYERCDFTFLTPSYNELRLKIFIVVDNDRSKDSQTIYKSAPCPHDIHSVIKRSDTPPYFYICESTPKTALVDIFEPSTEVDIRLITEAICTDFHSSQEDDIYNEAEILYEYVKSNLDINEQGKAILPEDYYPEDFDHLYSRASHRETFSFSIEGMQFTVQLSYEKEISNNASSIGLLQKRYWDIHLSSDDCNNIAPGQVPDRVPKLLNYAKKLARAVSKPDRNEETVTVPPEILARGDRAQSAYQTALKSGQVKNRRLPIVVVGQSRSGKTSLLRSLKGERFDPSEDSTIGARLQRSLSKEKGGDWENDTDPNVHFSECAASAMVPHLLTDSMDLDETDNDFDCQDRNNNYHLDDDNWIELRSEDSVLEDNMQRVLETSSEDKTDLHVEGHKMANEETIQGDFQSDTSFVQPKILPEEVETFTRNFLENPDSAKEMEKYLYFHTMDFAGQPVYSVTHPVFLPPKGVFLLVHNLKNDLYSQAVPMVKYGAVEERIDHHCSMTNMDHLEFWLSLVAANSPQEGGSPVFVVSTHADKFSLLNAKKISRKILEHLTRDGFLPGGHVADGIYTVDNTVSGGGGPNDPGVQNLKEAISDKARSLPQFDEDIPIRWLLFEKRLISLVKEEQKKYISHNEAEKIAIECEVDVESDELGTLLVYLHDLKVVIYAPENNMIIINTQWLLDIFAKVITVPPIECHDGHKQEWRKLENKGIIEVKFLEYLWRDLLDNNTPVQSLITIMEKFSLICKQQDGSFLVPAMLLNECDELIKDEMASALVIRFKSSHLPFAVFPRLFIAVDEMCTSKWPDASPPNISKNFARFYIFDGTFSLIFTSDVQTITVALVNEKSPDRQDDHLCSFILTFLNDSLHKMMQSFPWMKSLEFEFGIRCPICKDAGICKAHKRKACSRDKCVHFVSEKELRKIKPRCSKSPKKLKNIIPDSSFSLWFHKKDEHDHNVENVQQKLGNANALSLPCGTPEDDVCKEIIEVVHQNPSISMEEAKPLAKQLAFSLNLDKTSMEDPPKDITQKCRKSCQLLIARGAGVCVQALRDALPSGMTGPLKIKYGTLVKDMSYTTKEKLSKEFTGEETQWKAFAKEEVGLSVGEIKFWDNRTRNPVLEILNEKCGDWTVEKLYEAMVNSGANAIADLYL